MLEKIDSNFISSKINNINGVFHVELKDSFLRDVVELLDVCNIRTNLFIEKYLDLIVDLNQEILKNQALPPKKREKYLVYKKYDNRHKFELEGNTFQFEFNFDYNELKLVMSHFDKLKKSRDITAKYDLVVPLLMCILALVNHKYLSLLVLSLAQIFSYFWCKCSYQNDTIIWVNENSIDFLRKFYRSRIIPAKNQLYYFLNWLNMWLFGLMLIVFDLNIYTNGIRKVVSPHIPKCIINCISSFSSFIKSFCSKNIIDIYIFLKPFLKSGLMIIILGIVLFLIFYSIRYLLKLFSLDFWNGSFLSLSILLIGFVSKSDWAVVVLIMVIVNQIFSSEILFLSTKINSEKANLLEKNLKTFDVRKKEIRLKLQINLLILFFYLFVIVFNKSRFLYYFYSNNNSAPNGIIELFITGIERLLILLMLYYLISYPKFGFSKRMDKIKIIINYVADKLYTTDDIQVPEFRDKLEVYKGEEIEPKDVIKNLYDLPADIKVIWLNKPDWRKQHNNCTGEVLVIYPNRSAYSHRVDLYRLEKN